MRRIANEEIPTFKSEAEERAWYADRQRAELAAASAAAAFPFGTVLHVSSARGISRRSRAGVAFNGKASTSVEVVDGTDAEIAARVKGGEAVVSPLGAKAIAEDDGLIVHGGPRSRAMQVAADDELAKARTENERLRAELAKARTRTPNDGRPTRLGKANMSAPAPATGDDFGDDEDDLPEGGATTPNLPPPPATGKDPKGDGKPKA